jgi:predicted HTH transcriptional regulator
VFDYRESGLMVEFKRRPSKIPVDSMSPEISRKILMLIKKNPAITTLTMADKIKVNKRTILRHLERLKLEGKIERIGSTKRVIGKQ